MSDLQQQFDAAVAQSKQLPERPDNNTLLRLYALYKQGTSGDAAGERPGMADLGAARKRAPADALAVMRILLNLRL